MYDGPINSETSFHLLPVEQQNAILFHHNKLLLNWLRDLEGRIKNREQHIEFINARRTDLNKSLAFQQQTINRLEKNATDAKALQRTITRLSEENKRLQRLTDGNPHVSEIGRLHGLISQQESEIKALRQTLAILK